MIIPPPYDSASHIIFYDGYCVLCNGFLHHILSRDSHNHFIASPLSSSYANTLLKDFNLPISQSQTVLVLTHFSAQPTLLTHSDAALFCLISLGGLYRCFYAAYLVPRFFRDLVYKGIAKVRYTLFGKRVSCGRLSKPLSQKILHD